MKQITLDQIEKLLKDLETRLEKRFATKDDLKSLATKNDLKNTGNRLGKNISIKIRESEERTVKKIKLAIEESEAIVVANTDKNKADKYRLEDLEKRVKKLEQPSLS